MGNNLKKLREAAGWTHAEAAERMSVSRSQFIKLERGERRMTLEYIKAAARTFGVHESQVIDVATVPLIGYVGAGSVIDIFSDGQGPFEEVPATSTSTEKTVAVRIKGDCMGPFLNGWLAYYDQESMPPAPEFMGRLCIVGLADGRILLKKISHGTLPGRYKLESQFEPPMYDEAVEWIAPVDTLAPSQ